MSFLKYSALRLAILALAFVLFMALDLGLLFSGLAAVIVAFAVCYLFFPRLHIAASEDLHRAVSRSPKPRGRDRLRDSAEEDTEAEAYRRSRDDEELL
ncbi:DUF4229 domain-containing protein [Kocuria palustris]|uniref:DUF4229 domain-containing protein n=1 Tax=Kocuria palustris TaxID=71999 RepID=UPI0011A9A533|nr:DUF4229 domain-containing protein [Kocuria palustris]